MNFEVYNLWERQILLEHIWKKFLASKVSHFWNLPSISSSSSSSSSASSSLSPPHHHDHKAQSLTTCVNIVPKWSNKLRPKIYWELSPWSYIHNTWLGVRESVWDVLSQRGLELGHEDPAPWPRCLSSPFYFFSTWTRFLPKKYPAHEYANSLNLW